MRILKFSFIILVLLLLMPVGVFASEELFAEDPIIMMDSNRPIGDCIFATNGRNQILKYPFASTCETVYIYTLSALVNENKPEGGLTVLKCPLFTFESDIAIAGVHIPKTTYVLLC